MISKLIYFCLIQLLVAKCPKTVLYCFDSSNKRIGEIKVDQCWKWERFSCQPCSVDLKNKEISFYLYIYHCRYYFQDTFKVLDQKKVWTHKLLNAYHDIAFG